MTSSIRTAAAALLFGTCSLLGEDLLPLQNGNTWTYLESVSGQEFTVRVGTPVVINDRVYFSVNGYVEARVFMRMNEVGSLIYLDEDTGTERLLTPFEPVQGGWWEAPFRQCEQEGQASETRGVHRGGAGPIHQVVELRFRSYSCADTGVLSEQYGANIGMLRRVVSSIAGPREFNLVYARVGKQIIDALPHGRITVSVAESAATDLMTATLRLQLNSPLAMKLLFASAQEYDVVLKDEAGDVV